VSHFPHLVSLNCPGEDWKDAQLTLSTSNPTQLIPPPQNNRLSIRYQPSYMQESLSASSVRMKTKMFASPQSNSGGASHAEMDMVADTMAMAVVQTTGDLGGSYIFKPMHKSVILTRENKVPSFSVFCLTQ
jgi:hypothetical protein